MARIRELLKDRNFSLLWFSQVVSNFGDRLNQMALIGLIYVRTPGSTLELAKLFSFTILPVFLIGPMAGIYVDRWNKKWTMIASDLLRGILVLFIPIAITYYRSMVPIYILVFIIFSITRFFLTSKLSIIPDIVHKDRLLIANSLVSTTMMLATVIGFGVGGMIVGSLGPKGGFYVDAVTYFISSLMISFVSISFKDKLKSSTQKHNSEDLVIRKTLLGDIKGGLLYLKNDMDIRLVTNTMFLIMAGVGSLYIVLIVFVQQILHSSTEHLGFLMMFLGGGLFLGALGYGRFGTRLCKRKVINSFLFITGIMVVIFTLGLKLYPYFLIAGILSAILGMCVSPIVVSANTLLHEVMADDMRGRIFSSLEIIMHIAFFIFMILTSFVAEWLDRAWIIIIVGTIFSIIGLIKLVMGRQTE